MSKEQSMGMVINGIRIVNIIPVEIMAQRWYCVGFEPEDVDMGDAFHLLFIHNKDGREYENLFEMLQTIFVGKVPQLRIHSECLLGDAFKSDLCDCGEQLEFALKTIQKKHLGMIMYLRQEGRGIGLRAKFACLAAQEGYVNGVKAVEPMSSDEANLFYGFKVDEREYSIVPKVLSVFNIDRVQLLTSNEQKSASLTEAGIQIESQQDITRTHIIPGTRKHRELAEKATRHYVYKDLISHEN